MPARTARRPRTAAPAAPSAFAPQKAGASARDLALFEIERARVAVMAAVQGLPPAGAERPVGSGGWSIRELVLHLAVRDQARLDEFDALLAGTPPSWDPRDYTGRDAANAADLAPLRGLTWAQALERMELTRERLRARLHAAPAAPAERWTAAHPFGATMLELVRHDRHHAEQIKRARISS